MPTSTFNLQEISQSDKQVQQRWRSREEPASQSNYWKDKKIWTVLENQAILLPVGFVNIYISLCTNNSEYVTLLLEAASVSFPNW